MTYRSGWPTRVGTALHYDDAARSCTRGCPHPVKDRARNGLEFRRDRRPRGRQGGHRLLDTRGPELLPRMFDPFFHRQAGRQGRRARPVYQLRDHRAAWRNLEHSQSFRRRCGVHGRVACGEVRELRLAASVNPARGPSLDPAASAARPYAHTLVDQAILGAFPSCKELNARCRLPRRQERNASRARAGAACGIAPWRNSSIRR